MKMRSSLVPLVCLACLACGSQTRDGKARSDTAPAPNTTTTGGAMKAVSAHDYVASLHKGVDVETTRFNLI